MITAKRASAAAHGAPRRPPRSVIMRGQAAYRASARVRTRASDRPTCLDSRRTWMLFDGRAADRDVDGRNALADPHQADPWGQSSLSLPVSSAKCTHRRTAGPVAGNGAVRCNLYLARRARRTGSGNAPELNNRAIPKRQSVMYRTCIMAQSAVSHALSGSNTMPNIEFGVEGVMKFGEFAHRMGVT